MAKCLICEHELGDDDFNHKECLKCGSRLLHRLVPDMAVLNMVRVSRGMEPISQAAAHATIKSIMFDMFAYYTKDIGATGNT